MKYRKMPSLFSCGLKSLAISFLLFAGFLKLEAQVLGDTITLKLVKETVDQIYNMRFTSADETCDRINEKYPDHPVTFLLRGMIVYWKNYPLLSGSDESESFESHMLTCIDKCNEYEPENEAEFLLATLCARGSLLAYYIGNDLQSKVTSLGRVSYRYLRRSFSFTGTYPDFLFFTGLYNYYREAYADAHPVYRPLLALFPRGDREKGLKELRTAFRESIFLRAEASTFLSSNYKYFENDFSNASYFSRAIYYEYPRNMVYLINCIEDMLLTRKYDEAEKLLDSPVASTKNKYYEAQLTILRGILSEKKYKEMSRAEQEYTTGAENILTFGDYGKQYAAYAYFGLSRISAIDKNRQTQRMYHRRAMEMTDFEDVNFNDSIKVE